MTSRWCVIGIKYERLNGLRLLTRIENRGRPGNTLDTILQRAGIPLLSDEELARRLAELEAQEQMRLKALEIKALESSE